MIHRPPYKQNYRDTRPKVGEVTYWRAENIRQYISSALSLTSSTRAVSFRSAEAVLGDVCACIFYVWVWFKVILGTNETVDKVRTNIGRYLGSVLAVNETGVRYEAIISIVTAQYLGNTRTKAGILYNTGLYWANTRVTLTHKTQYAPRSYSARSKLAAHGRISYIPQATYSLAVIGWSI